MSIRQRAQRVSMAATGAALVSIYVASVAWGVQLAYDVAGGIVVGHILALVTVPLLLHLTRKEDDGWIRVIIVGGLVVKLVGTLARYFVTFSVYGGGDAFVYDRVGGEIATALRRGDFLVDTGQQVIGTGFVELFTGAVYAITGPTRLGGFLVYSWLGFWGLYLFYRAVRVALPEAEHRRYAALVFFLPSMVFWPSSIGKDALMTLGLGMAAYGTARLVSHRRHAWLWLIPGLVGTGLVRPHITITVVVSLGVAYLFTGARRGGFGAPLAKAAGLVALLVVFSLTLSSVESKFKLQEGEGVEDVLARTEARTATDGSEFDAVAARSVLDIPQAAFSVLFRPLPYEARNLQTLLASLEGALLLLLFVRNWRRLANIIPRRRAPYLAFVGTYSLLFVIAFSNLGNFGILARQRVQLFPFVLVLLVVARPARQPSPDPVVAPAPRSLRRRVALPS